MSASARMYPRLLRRVRAVIIDEVVLLAALAAWWWTVGMADGASTALKVGSLCLVFVIVDPVLVAWTGGTVGHHLMGLKVRSAARDARINPLLATVRALLRYLLGALSLLLILLTKKHQAIHDLATGSIVVLRDPQRHSGREKLAERGGHAH